MRLDDEVEIEPSKKVEGELRAPPSKSYTHRAMFIGLLSPGRTKINDPLVCEDTEATLEAVKNFGAKTDWNYVDSDGSIKDAYISAVESGTTARFSIGVGCLSKGHSEVDGIKSLKDRPMEPLLDALERSGVDLESNDGDLPVILKDDNISMSSVEIDGNISSQFISALVFIGVKKGLEINIKKEIVSKPYLMMTIDMLKKNGSNIDMGDKKIDVKKGVKADRIEIPGDYSSASFLMAAGALFGEVKIKGLRFRDFQADSKIIDLLRRFGADVEVKDGFIKVKKGKLEGINIDCTHFPDLFPILCVLGAYAERESIIKAPQLRYKESDRIRAMYNNLTKLDVDVEEMEEGLLIHGGDRPRGGIVEPMDDHRIAIAMSIAGLGAGEKITIVNSSCVDKSYPTFYDDLNKMTVI